MLIIIVVDVYPDFLGQLLGCIETGPSQHLPAHDVEPNLHHLRTAFGGGGVMEMHVRVPCKPLSTGFVGTVIVKNYVQFHPLRQRRTLAPYHLIHEREKILPFLGLRRLPLHRTRYDIQCGEKIYHPIPWVAAVHSRDHGSVTFAHILLLLRLDLDPGFLVDADNDGILGGV